MATKRGPLTAEEAKSGLGLRVRELRRAKDWTQQQAAERLDIATENYAHIEQGRRLVRLDTLVKLANLFEVDVADLFAQPENVVVRPGRPPKDG